MIAAARTTIRNTADAGAALAAAEKGTRVRRFGDVDSIARAICAVVESEWIFAVLTVDQLVGVSVVVDAAQGERFAKSYKGTPESTHARATFTTRGWVVDSVSRRPVNTRTTTTYVLLQLSAEQLQQAAQRWGRGYGIAVTR